MNFSVLFPVFLPLGIVFFVFTLTMLLQRTSYKELLKRFTYSDTFPVSIKPHLFQYGLARIKNATKVAEQGEDLFIKIWFIPALKIPYSAFSEIQAKEDFLQRSRVQFKFKDNSLKPVAILFKKEQLMDFPALRKKLTTLSAIPAKQSPKNIQDAAHLVELKSQLGSVLRGVLAAVLIFLALWVYTLRYGSPF